MKYVNLRLQDAEHARMVAAADAKFMPLTSMLRMVFAEYEAKQKAQQPSAPAQKIGKRDQAFLDYKEIMDNLPTNWTSELFDSTFTSIEALRIRGGNLSHTEMPMPRAMITWGNARYGFHGSLPEYKTPEEDAAEIAAKAVRLAADDDIEAELGITFDDDANQE